MKIASLRKKMICDKPFNAIQFHFDWAVMTEHNFLAPNVTSLCFMLKMVSDQLLSNNRKALSFMVLFVPSESALSFVKCNFSTISSALKVHVY